MKTTTPAARRGPSLATKAAIAAELESRKLERLMSGRPRIAGRIRDAERNRLAYLHLAATA